MLYYCKFTHDGFIKESFYREGNSAEEVLKGLECFDFGEGTWQVFEPEVSE